MTAWNKGQMAIKVSIEALDAALPKGMKAFCRHCIISAARYMELDNVAITVVITNDEAIAAVNKRYRKKAGPTDVISFAYREEAMPVVEKTEHLGDIFISIETAQRQADENNDTLKEEMQRLMVHGTLHLLGYDHEKSAYKKRQMQKKERELLVYLHA